MSDDDDVDLHAIGEHLGELQDEELEKRDDLAQVRSRLLSPARRSKAPTWWVAPALTTVAATVVAIVLLRPDPEPEPLGFTHQGAAGTEGAWVTSEDEATRLDFSDGSSVDLAPRSGVRIAELDADGARLDLQRGSMHVAVVHRDEDTRWQIQAGPFAVHVVGTAFEVAWDPGSERFALHLEEGRVRVAGPTVTERIVDVGETVTVDLGRRRMEVVQLDLDLEGLESDDENESTDEAIDEAIDEAVVALPRRPSKVRRLRIDWRSLVEQGRHAEAVAAADWDRELAEGTASDVMRLANAARLAGERTRAKSAYLSVRTRHEGTGEAADAAFFLGRMEMGARRFAEAAVWFEHSVAEAPEGGYAMVARGRLVEAYRRAEAPRRARASARAYLDSHPHGPHADQARRMLDEDIVANRPPREAWGANAE